MYFLCDSSLSLCPSVHHGVFKLFLLCLSKGVGLGVRSESSEDVCVYAHVCVCVFSGKEVCSDMSFSEFGCGHGKGVGKSHG